MNKEIHQLKKENGRLRYEIDTYLEEIIQLRKELAFYKDENDILVCIRLHSFYERNMVDPLCILTPPPFS